MKFSLGLPCARYELAVARSPRANASRYERTIEEGPPAVAATVCAGAALTLGGGGAVDAGDGRTAVKRATATCRACDRAGLALGLGVVSASLGNGFAACVRIGAGFALGTGVVDAVATGVGAAVGKTVGGAVAANTRGGAGTGLGGAAAAIGGSDLAERFEPPKKCASAPPRSSPAKMTTSTSGKSGIPPPAGSSSERRRRRGPSIYPASRSAKATRIEAGRATTSSGRCSTKSAVASLSSAGLLCAYVNKA